MHEAYISERGVNPNFVGKGKGITWGKEKDAASAGEKQTNDRNLDQFLIKDHSFCTQQIFAPSWWVGSGMHNHKVKRFFKPSPQPPCNPTHMMNIRVH